MALWGRDTPVTQAFPTKISGMLMHHGLGTLGRVSDCSLLGIQEAVGKGVVTIESVLRALLDANLLKQKEFEVWQLRNKRFPHTRSVDPEVATRNTYVWYVFGRALSVFMVDKGFGTLASLSRATDTELRFMKFSTGARAQIRQVLLRAGLNAPRTLRECRGPDTWWKKAEDAPKGLWLLTWSSQGGMNVATCKRLGGGGVEWWSEVSEESPIKLDWIPSHFTFLPAEPKFKRGGGDE